MPKNELPHKNTAMIFTTDSKSVKLETMGSAYEPHQIEVLTDSNISEVYMMAQLYLDEAGEAARNFILSRLDEKSQSFSIETKNSDGSFVEVFKAQVDEVSKKVSFVMKLTDSSQELLINIMNNMKNPQIKSNLKLTKALELMRAVPNLSFSVEVLRNLEQQVKVDASKISAKEKEQILAELNKRTPQEKTSHPHM